MRIRMILKLLFVDLIHSLQLDPGICNPVREQKEQSKTFSDETKQKQFSGESCETILHSWQNI